jgi:DNA mismatch repair protein MutS
MQLPDGPHADALLPKGPHPDAWLPKGPHADALLPDAAPAPTTVAPAASVPSAPFPGSDTPAMAQYLSAKRRHPDALLFFRMGDFYELFFEDAKTAADALGLTLTARDRERKVPMAGVPARSADVYLRRLLAQGFKVAICEQLTDPADAKGLIERDVVRVLTPGTLTDDESLDPRASNFLLALRPPGKKERRRKAGLAWVGPVHRPLPGGRPRARGGARRSRAHRALRDPAAGERGGHGVGRALEGRAQGRRHLRAPLDRRGGGRRAGAHGALPRGHAQGLRPRAPGAQRGRGRRGAQYLRQTQRTSLAHVSKIERHDPAGVMVLERGTRRRLELVERTDGSRDATLLSVLDRTRTPMGGRMLRDWLLAPLTDREAIQRRLDGVEELVKDAFLRRDLRAALSEVKDLERILARVATQRASARDLVAMGRSLEALPRVLEPLQGVYSRTLADLRQRLETFDALAQRLASTLVDDPPPVLTEGGLVRPGASAELDELKDLAKNAKDWIAAYQASEAARTGIGSLKVGYNKVFGYYLEITHTHRDRVPPEYVRKQTLTTAERYVTPELSEHEQKVLRADERAKDLERRMFLELRDAVAEKIAPLQGTAAVLAEIDTLASLAEVAAARDYVRPEILEDRTLELRDARHPVVETVLAGGERFVPNDVALDAERRIALITGPNMAGKSTYIRQAALLVLMAQMGSFVPASKARVGLCDRVFTRVGAEDDLARGQSTFMVEMSEAALILHQATERSLVILDEIGRGTSTFDGIAIAWAVTEYLSEVVGARTLFATHYAEVTQLAEELKSVFNLNVAVREWGDSIVFLRRIQEGAADRSYGIHVARLAGVPEAVVARAKDVLATLERAQGGATAHLAKRAPEPLPARDLQLGLFAPPPPHPAVEALKALDPDSLTPLQALQKLAELKRLSEA